jgi:hypothetical protein
MADQNQGQQQPQQQGQGQQQPQQQGQQQPPPQTDDPNLAAQQAQQAKRQEGKPTGYVSPTQAVSGYEVQTGGASATGQGLVPSDQKGLPTDPTTETGRRAQEQTAVRNPKAGATPQDPVGQPNFFPSQAQQDAEHVPTPQQIKENSMGHAEHAQVKAGEIEATQAAHAQAAQTTAELQGAARARQMAQQQAEEAAQKAAQQSAGQQAQEAGRQAAEKAQQMAAARQPQQQGGGGQAGQGQPQPQQQGQPQPQQQGQPASATVQQAHRQEEADSKKLQRLQEEAHEAMRVSQERPNDQNLKQQAEQKMRAAQQFQAECDQKKRAVHQQEEAAVRREEKR